MAGTKAGGAKAAATNRAKYGTSFYARIGAKGGKSTGLKGFAVNRDLARKAGAIGGKKSRRGKAFKVEPLQVAEAMAAVVEDNEQKNYDLAA